MLTDRQLIALNLLKNTIDSQASVMSMARNVEGTKKLINHALTLADLFLETSNSEQFNEALDSQYLESALGE